MIYNPAWSAFVASGSHEHAMPHISGRLEEERALNAEIVSQRMAIIDGMLADLRSLTVRVRQMRESLEG